jgi:hypothetical protein
LIRLIRSPLREAELEEAKGRAEENEAHFEEVV